MPPAGLAGGGSMTVQEIDQVIAYISSQQVPQAAVVAKADRIVPLTLARIDNGAAETQVRINQQQARIDEVKAAPGLFAEIGGLADDVLDLLGGDGTCTQASAELALTTCDDPGLDTDRDGLTDEAERQLTDIAAVAHNELTTLSFNADGTANPLQEDVYDVVYDPANAFSNSDLAGRPVEDLVTTDAMLTALEGDLLILEITATKQEDFLRPLEAGMVKLEEAAALMLWEVDLAAVAAAMDVSAEEAERAVGLFNGYCARCHSGGYSAGVTFEVGPGRGAWGPAINDGRAIVQFPEFEDHVEFILEGSDNAAPYGVNGIGTGRMPGFGTSLSDADIRLIAMYERTL